MNMRKIIAVMAAVLMLCSIIPMGAMVSAASIFSANFDNGEVVFSVSADDTAVIEDGVLHWTTVGWKNLYKSFSGVAGTEYVLSVKAKASQAVDLKFVFHNGSWSGYVAPDFVPTLSTEWTTYTYHFTPTEKGIVLLLQAKAAAEIWLDDIKVSEYIAPVDPDVPDDAVYFENFEEDHTWASGNANASMEIIPAGDAPVTKAENGNYVVKHTIPASVYPYISDRTGISVQPNTDYIVSFDALNTTANWPLQVIIGENYWLGGAFALSLSQQIKPSATAWETYSFVFNTGDHNKIWLGAKSQWADTTVYFDNFYIAPMNGSVQNDGYLKNGNFEAGALEWLHTSNTEIVADPTDAGQGNVIKTNENTGSVHMFSQPATNLVAGHEYVLSFKVYGYTTAVSNAAFFVKFPSSCSGFTFGGDLVGLVYSGTTTRYNVNSNLNKWMTATVTFTTSADVALIDFMNYRPNGGQYYFDDISITPKHAWVAATCTDPKTCSVCGATEGEALGHTPGAEADCENAQTCTVCGEVLNAALGHTPGAEADCENAQTCTVCGEVLNAALGHSWTDATCTAPKTCSVCGATEGEALGHTWTDATCTAPKTCSVCGETEGEALGHTWTDATCTAPKTCSVCGETEGEALGHIYSDCLDTDCDECGAVRDDAGHNLTYVEAVVPANCQETGHAEYWYCENCDCYFGDAEATWQHNPAWMYYTGDCVRPEDAADCAVVPCELCGNDTYGAGEHDTGVPACQTGTCSKCGETIEGYGCQNYDTPACEDGVCYYCGGFVAGFGHENGAWAACCDGECSYGCGLVYPATADHVDEDADDYCDTCWTHLNHDVDPCVGGECSICWTYVEGAHTYDNEFDTTCNVCGETITVELPISKVGFSVSPDVSGLAAQFNIEVEGLAIKAGKFTQADYGNATVNGYKLLSMGAIVNNGVKELDIPCVYLCELYDTSAKFNIRVIKIPADKLDVEITFTPYFVVEIDGVATTVYGEPVAASYNSRVPQE